MTRWLAAIFACLLPFGLLAFGATAATAHEARPAYLVIDRSVSGTVNVTWKQPVIGDYALRLVPHLSTGWLERQPDRTYVSDGYALKDWKIDVSGDKPGGDLVVDIEGLSRSLTDALVKVKEPSGDENSFILKPDHSSATISAGAPGSSSAFQFVIYGFEHIMDGLDHLLFVLGLVLIGRSYRALAFTISAFTLAHSITLALATLGYVAIDSTVVETLIALSIFFLGVEVVRARQGKTSLMIRYPWLVAFGFGLLHGLGFASGLAALNMSQVDVAKALVMFNVGVELGQLAFVAVVLLVLRGLEMVRVRYATYARIGSAHCIGSLGAFWAINNSLLLFGVRL